MNAALPVFYVIDHAVAQAVVLNVNIAHKHIVRSSGVESREERGSRERKGGPDPGTSHNMDLADLLSEKVSPRILNSHHKM